MRIEAFSQGKDPARPDANEDRFVILPGRAYAVIDGVTARGPARYDGKLSGQYAADLLQRTLEQAVGNDAGLDGLALVQCLTDAVAASYRRFGMLDRVRDDANPRFSATLALVLEQGEQLEIVLVGDSGVRINGGRMFQVNKDLDGITAALRAAAWRHAAARTDDPQLRETVSRRIVFQGTRRSADVHGGGNGLLSAEDLRSIEADAAAACARGYPDVPPDLVARLLQGGILNEQGRHQNNAASPLGYSCLDGFPIPRRLIVTHRLDLHGVHRVELFTDGYFVPGEGFGVAAWERRFAEIEAEDPAKVGRCPSVKGSVGRLWADDRTYVGIQRGTGEQD